MILSTLFGREQDATYIRQCAIAGNCASIVGVSNLGKSLLLRHLCVMNDKTMPTFVYIDCNQMHTRTTRALFTTIWRELVTVLESRIDNVDVHVRALKLLDTMIDSTDTQSIGMLFDQGIALAIKHVPHPLVLMLDDFDEAYQHIEPQTFLNLRALKDRHDGELVYITATERELHRLNKSREQGEFYELISPRVHFLHFMSAEDTRNYCNTFATREHVTFSNADIAFIQQNADGHPGLVQAVAYALGRVTGEPTRNQHQDRVIHQIVQDNLATDVDVQSECAKIWDDLENDEREILLHPAHNGNESQDVATRSLRNKFILREIEDNFEIFPRLFADFVRRQKLQQQPDSRGIFLDVDAGEVFIDGKATEPLTDLEFRLLTFLYGKLDRVCDKYSIVENVWGQQFIDDVDDGRIEKLVSRVRSKIESDPAKPRYLLSVRGRGYKLVR